MDNDKNPMGTSPENGGEASSGAPEATGIRPGREVIGIEEAIDRFRRGEMVIVVDDESRENEGDFIFGAQFTTTDSINFLLNHARGMICVPATEERLARLKLEKMVPANTAKHQTNFTVTVDHRDTSTGISAADRALTIRALADPETRPEDLLRPGHISPLGAVEGGVLVRAGHTEAAVDLARLAGVEPVAVLCEILNEDGTMARMSHLRRLACDLRVPIIAIQDLIAYRTRREKLVRRTLTTEVPNVHGEWTLHLYETLINDDAHLALVMGEPEKQESALVRVHSKCLTGDALGSLRCDCGAQLNTAMQMIAREGHGVILYLDQEGRGIGLKNKLRAYVLQDQGKDTVEANEALGFKADLREYGIGAQILTDLGLKRIRIMTNNPRKIVGIQGFGLEVAGRVPMEVGRHKSNVAYLRAKAAKLGHVFLETLADCEPAAHSSDGSH